MHLNYAISYKVYVPVPELEELFDTDFEELSFVLVLLIVILIPSELDLTMYSEFLVSPILLALFELSDEEDDEEEEKDLLEVPLPDILSLFVEIFAVRSVVKESLCTALLFNLSTIPIRVPLRFRA